jgi:hypothetical protein
MNTIQITNEDGAVINYTEAEVLRFIKKADETNDIIKYLDSANQTIRKNNNAVRDFFSEVEWQDGEQTVNKADVNMLLESIGANKLTTKYGGTFTITGTFSVEADDANDAEDMVVNNTSVDFYDGDLDVDNIEVHDLEENY